MSTPAPSLATARWRGRSGYLGLEDESSGSESRVPVSVEGVEDVVSLSAGNRSTCAVVVDGGVWCWGATPSSEVDPSDTDRGTLPTRVAGIDDAESVAVGNGSACAVRRDHTLSCWGRNTFGQLGDGTTGDSSLPVEVSTF